MIIRVTPAKANKIKVDIEGFWKLPLFHTGFKMVDIMNVCMCVCVCASEIDR